jgi:hypothetical protein
VTRDEGDKVGLRIIKVIICIFGQLGLVDFVGKVLWVGIFYIVGDGILVKFDFFGRLGFGLGKHFTPVWVTNEILTGFIFF